mmetsp:Transcript_1547/g.5682  ORF Transcript_1547/g.5682 Transcript_1547/m.5682 type:complete len:240 (-) Transcript_1547:1365-2084(-)
MIRPLGACAGAGMGATRTFFLSAGFEAAATGAVPAMTAAAAAVEMVVLTGTGTDAGVADANRCARLSIFWRSATSLSLSSSSCSGLSCVRSSLITSGSSFATGVRAAMAAALGAGAFGVVVAAVGVLSATLVVTTSGAACFSSSSTSLSTSFISSSSSSSPSPPPPPQPLTLGGRPAIPRRLFLSIVCANSDAPRPLRDPSSRMYDERMSAMSGVRFARLSIRRSWFLSSTREMRPLSS